MVGSAAFDATAAEYDAFMGRYSQPLAGLFADEVAVERGQAGLDVGCGPGALTAVLVERLGAERTAAVDPSPSFVAACAARHPGVDVRLAGAESLPFEDASFDRALASLVLHFVTATDAAVDELRRVLRPGGVAGVTVWDFGDGMRLLRHFWDAALAIDATAPDEALVLRFGVGGEARDLFAGAGFVDVDERMLTVTSRYADVDEVWSSLLAGVGPAGAYCASLDDDTRSALRARFVVELGSPESSFELTAVARCTTGTAPG